MGRWKLRAWLPAAALAAAGAGTLTYMKLLPVGRASELETAQTPASASSPAPSESSLPVASAVPTPESAIERPPRCREQRAQDFLLRKGQIAKIGAPASEHAQIEANRRRSIEYRTKQYGRFPGVGSRADNPLPPSAYAKRTTFFGLPLVLHQKVVPALACVETALRRDCARDVYQPRQVGGLRLENTFKDYEVSNHVYGIALDIDSQDNPCCGCVGKWREHPACKKQVASPFERMVMPRCWVEVFERYGFHWLGHDEIEDTMHFEFLGDPDRIFE
jgi:hypothetical protein